MEEVLPPQTEDGAGFELTRIRQFTVFMENKVGRLQGLVRAFENGGCRIAALSIHNSADTALIRLICCNPDIGREILGREKFSFAEQEVLAVELPRNTRQPLLALTAAILTAEINIHYIYPLLVRPNGPAVVIYVDDLTLAAQLLIRKSFRLIGESDIKKLGDCK